MFLLASQNLCPVGSNYWYCVLLYIFNVVCTIFESLIYIYLLVDKLRVLYIIALDIYCFVHPEGNVCYLTSCLCS